MTCSQNQLIAPNNVQIFGDNLTVTGSISNTEIYPENFGAKGDGINDDTAEIQKSINFMANSIYSKFNVNQTGIIILSNKVYNISNVYLRSNITIEGSGQYSTRINPIGATGYVFDVNDVNTTDRIVFCKISDLMISNYRIFTAKSPVLATYGGINLSFAMNCIIENVWIANMEKEGLNIQDAFDSEFHNVVNFFNGTGVVPSTRIYNSAGEVSNALKFLNCRWEGSPFLLSIDNGVGGSNQPRQNQFIGCKLESGTSSGNTSSIYIGNAALLTFEACMFVTQIDIPMVLVSTNVSDARGVRFIGCDWTSATGSGYGIKKGTKAIGVSIVGNSFYAMKTIATGNNFIINSNSFYDNTTPIIDVDESVIIVVASAFHFFNKKRDFLG
jgi:hypothetical protein